MRTLTAMDEVEVTTTANHAPLRRDGRAVHPDWQTPKKPGTRYQVTMTSSDGTQTSALFKLK